MSAEDEIKKEVEETGTKEVEAEEASKEVFAGAEAQGEAPAAKGEPGAADGDAADQAPGKDGGRGGAAPAKTSISEDLAEARRKAQEVGDPSLVVLLVLRCGCGRGEESSIGLRNGRGVESLRVCRVSEG
jgi:hypothetical protein